MMAWVGLLFGSSLGLYGALLVVRKRGRYWWLGILLIPLAYAAGFFFAKLIDFEPAASSGVRPPEYLPRLIVLSSRCRNPKDEVIPASAALSSFAVGPVAWQMTSSRSSQSDSTGNGFDHIAPSLDGMAKGDAAVCVGPEGGIPV
jgi:hypothetical protein